MKLHFDPNQQFQHDAINAIVEIFEGQSLNQGDFSFSMSSESYMFTEGGVGNRLEISEEQILRNVQEVQKKNEIKITDKLDGMNFSVEMETGTGKTYVYLRTIYELNKKTVYFVAETKSAGQELKISEKRKIKCGYSHFNEFEDVKYRQIATVGELDSI
ncbi:MAG: DEAD/DEAH box helicase family protein [Spirochaetales bacterium]|nr:DEAD/DEAH box helicase family protein [Spirochaetales bacterium]